MVLVDPVELNQPILVQTGQYPSFCLAVSLSCTISQTPEPDLHNQDHCTLSTDQASFTVINLFLWPVRSELYASMPP